MIENIKAGERITQAVLLRLQKVGNSSNGAVAPAESGQLFQRRCVCQRDGGR